MTHPLALGRSALAYLRATAGALSADVVLTSDGAGWVLDQFSRQLQAALRSRLRLAVTNAPVASFGRQIVHFIDGQCFHDAHWEERRWHSNVEIGLWWHGNEHSIEPSISEAARRIERISRRLARVHVACSISRDTVRRLGVAEDRIALLPLGIDLNLFQPPHSASQRREAREALGIPTDAVVIGSFQKDGSGWGDGETPKRIKGPDIFVRVVTRLAEMYPVFALIPGPSRGYVKRELRAAGVPFWNAGFMPFQSLPAHYHACDIYLMTGREEGGPAAVLEAPACGVPFIGHRVGMAPDVLVHGQSALLSEVDDVEELVAHATRLLSDRTLRHDLANAGLDAVQRFGWQEVAPQYGRLYSGLTANR